jgi:hypothetical protein
LWSIVSALAFLGRLSIDVTESWIGGPAGGSQVYGTIVTAADVSVWCSARVHAYTDLA